VITIPTGDLTGVLADVIPFASTEDDLPEVNCVRLEWNGQMLETRATDRYRIACSGWEPGDISAGEAVQDDLFTEWGSGDDPWSTTVALDEAKELVKVFKLGEKEWACPLTVDYDSARDRLTVKRARETGHSAITITVEGTGAEFPDVRKVLGKSDVIEPVKGLGYNAKYLADFAKVRARGPLLLRFTGENSLTHVSIGSRFYGAIMPVRLGDG
jgi:DNA polymerase III sliding clamp (beta) subunit (PCNA family)